KRDGVVVALGTEQDDGIGGRVPVGGGDERRGTRRPAIDDDARPPPPRGFWEDRGPQRDRGGGRAEGEDNPANHAAPANNVDRFHAVLLVGVRGQERQLFNFFFLTPDP